MKKSYVIKIVLLLLLFTSISPSGFSLPTIDISTTPTEKLYWKGGKVTFHANSFSSDLKLLKVFFDPALNTKYPQIKSFSLSGSQITVELGENQKTEENTLRLTYYTTAGVGVTNSFVIGAMNKEEPAEPYYWLKEIDSPILNESDDILYIAPGSRVIMSDVRQGLNYSYQWVGGRVFCLYSPEQDVDSGEPLTGATQDGVVFLPYNRSPYFSGYVKLYLQTIWNSLTGGEQLRFYSNTVEIKEIDEDYFKDIILTSRNQSMNSVKDASQTFGIYPDRYYDSRIVYRFNVSYAWQKKESGSYDWTTVPGATTEYLPEIMRISSNTSFRRITYFGSRELYSNEIYMQLETGNNEIALVYAENPLDGFFVNSIKEPNIQPDSICWEWRTVGNQGWGNRIKTNSSTYTTGPISQSRYLRRVYYKQGTPYASNEILVGMSEKRIVNRTYTSNKGASYVDDIEYYDDFGQKIQLVSVNASPDGNKDIIQTTEIGLRGELNKEYVPYAKTVGNTFDLTYRNPANWSFEGQDPAYAFTSTAYEPNPFRRMQKSTGPGYVRHTEDKSTRLSYGYNVANDIINWQVSFDGVLTSEGYLPAGALYLTETITPDGRISQEYKNIEDKVVLSRVFDDTTMLNTYYVYDKIGRLTYVMPPMVDHAHITQQQIDELCYYYCYDELGHPITIKTPGAAPNYYVYDKKDRVVLTQNGNGRVGNKWDYALYDNFNRVVEVGQISSNESFESLKATASVLENYIPANREPIKYLFYDNYNYTGVHPFIQAENISGYIDSDMNPENGYSDLTAGLKTGIRVKMLGTDAWLTKTYYYDSQNRLIQQIDDSADSALGESCFSFQYDFVGNILSSRERHGLSAPDVLLSSYLYDDRGRLVSGSYSLNNGKSATIKYEYDAVGRMKKVRYGDEINGFDEEYSYGISGSLLRKKSPYFAMGLRYHDPLMSSSTPSWDGNISEWSWHYGPDGSEQTYAFSYDKLSQLMAVKQYVDGVANDLFVEKGLSYDKNGNILTMERIANGMMADQLSYSYSGNQLSALSGSRTGTYAYDQVGNIIHDGANDLDLTYNPLNLLEKVEDKGGILAKYTYLGDGTKLSAFDAVGNGLFYAGSLVYRKQGGTSSLESAAFAGGRLTVTSNTIEPYYHLTDHLGSVRCIIDAKGQVLERNDYYPFGLRWENVQQLVSDNRYRYNGKENQSFANVPYVDYGARMYDSRIGRWMAQDPLCQFYSPYLFSANNAVRFVDPNGLWTSVDGGFSTNNPFEMADFLSGAKNNFFGQGPFAYVENYYNLDMYVNANLGKKIRDDGMLATTIKQALIMSKGPWSNWTPANMDEVQAWQNDFARNMDHYLTMNDPFVKAVHRGQLAFVAGAMDFTGGIISKVGKSLTIAGYIMSAAGGSGLALVKAGNILSQAGTFLSASSDFLYGYKNRAIFNIAVDLGGAGFNGVFNAGGLTAGEQGIFGLLSVIPNGLFDYAGTTINN